MRNVLDAGWYHGGPLSRLCIDAGGSGVVKSRTDLQIDDGWDEEVVARGSITYSRLNEISF